MKLKNLLLIIIGAVILSSCGKKSNFNVNINSTKDTLSYALGVDVATSLSNSNLGDIDYNAFMNGLEDYLNKNDLKIKEEDIKPFIQKYVSKVRQMKLEKNLEDGKKFLEENKKRDGVITTESGLQYEIIQEGTGKSPIATDIVVCNYKGTLIDGTEFDSSEKNGKPAEFPLNRVIPGWTEGLQLMKEGAKYKFYIPTELGYGVRVRPGGLIEPNMALIFEVELLQVKDAPVEKPAERPTMPSKRN